MKYSDFINATIMNMDQDSFEAIKKALIGEYISFSIIAEEDISKAVLAEKLCDYFEKLELKTRTDFDKQVETYIKDIDSIVKKHIAKMPQPKKNDQTPVVTPRSRKYYEKALATKNSRNLSVRNLLDYSRIMFCLYASIIKARYKEITDLDFSISSLKPNAIISSMKSEPNTIVGTKKNLVGIKKNRFDIKNLYSPDTCTFIMSMLLLQKIINDKVLGEYYHE